MTDMGSNQGLITQTDDVGISIAATLPRTVAVINGKGGVGKTSITANLAGLFAMADYKVCAFDLDPQGNLGIDLGYKGAGLGDDGKGLLQACVSGAIPTPLQNVRPNLDVVPGGTELHDLAAFLQTRKLHGRTDNDNISASIRGLAASYDITFLDCPPGYSIIQEGALQAARYVLIPTKTDDASRDGLREVARRFATARETNPDLELIGVVLFGLKAGASRLRKLAVSRLAQDLGGESLIFSSVISQVEAAAVDARRRGQLAHELERALEDAPKWYEQLRNPDAARTTVAASAVSLAENYAALAHELIGRIQTAENTEVTA